MLTDAEKAIVKRMELSYSPQDNTQGVFLDGEEVVRLIPSIWRPPLLRGFHPESDARETFQAACHRQRMALDLVLRHVVAVQLAKEPQRD